MPQQQTSTISFSLCQVNCFLHSLFFSLLICPRLSLQSIACASCSVDLLLLASLRSDLLELGAEGKVLLSLGEEGGLESSVGGRSLLREFVLGFVPCGQQRESDIGGGSNSVSEANSLCGLGLHLLLCETSGIVAVIQTILVNSQPLLHKLLLGVGTRRCGRASCGGAQRSHGDDESVGSAKGHSHEGEKCNELHFAAPKKANTNTREMNSGATH
mmetsp:Transcript_27945/g.54773  ORF Transcript_27945/g.54773 Transcript_27945/m.54773 type:complete len:215 (-) Transcript_27945:52-696(-)